MDSFAGILEAHDLHPRVAYALRQRGYIIVNEYRYAPYGMESGGSIDFVGIHPKTGQVVIVECKRSIASLTALEDQLYKYFHAFYVLDAHKEVYAFEMTDTQRAWLESRKIHAYTLTMADTKAGLRTTPEQWRLFRAIFNYWHLGSMLPCLNGGLYEPSDLFGTPQHRHQNDIFDVEQYRKSLGHEVD